MLGGWLDGEQDWRLYLVHGLSDGVGLGVGADRKLGVSVFGGRVVGVIIVIERVLEHRIPKHSLPGIAVEVRQAIIVRGSSGKPIVEHAVKLGSYETSRRIQYQWDCTGMFRQKNYVNHPSRPWFPFRYLLAIRYLFVEDVNGASPHV